MSLAVHWREAAGRAQLINLLALAYCALTAPFQQRDHHSQSQPLLVRSCRFPPKMMLANSKTVTRSAVAARSPSLPAVRPRSLVVRRFKVRSAAAEATMHLTGTCPTYALQLTMQQTMFILKPIFWLRL